MLELSREVARAFQILCRTFIYYNVLLDRRQIVAVGVLTGRKDFVLLYAYLVGRLLRR